MLFRKHIKSSSLSSCAFLSSFFLPLDLLVLKSSSLFCRHCSPVHYFFSVFTSHHWASLSVCFPNLHPKFQLYIYNQLVRFLTKREQKLMQRRQHAEELLEWKRRLDAEEAEIRQMEKQALAAWDKELIKPQTPKKELEDQTTEQKVYPAEAYFCVSFLILTCCLNILLHTDFSILGGNLRGPGKETYLFWWYRTQLFRYNRKHL
nr:uncharacterized protein LOC105875483 [Microcebus murinus]